MTTRIALLLAILLASSCVTTRGTMPVPPTDQQLANDGSPQQQEALLKRYEVRLVESSFFGLLGSEVIEVGPARRPTTEGWADLDAHADVRSYLNAALQRDVSTSWAMWRSIGFVAVGGAIIVGVLWLATTVAFNILAAAGVRGFESAGNAYLGAVPAVTGAASLISAVLFGTFITTEVACAAALGFSQFMVKRGIRGEVSEFNTQLRKRIQQNAAAPAPVEPPPPSTPMTEEPQPALPSPEQPLPDAQ